MAKALFHAEYFFTRSISEMIKISAQHATETLTVSGFLISFSNKHIPCTYVQASRITVRAANYDRRIHKHQQTKARKDRQADVRAYRVDSVQGGSHRNHNEQTNDIKPTKNTEN